MTLQLNVAKEAWPQIDQSHNIDRSERREERDTTDLMSQEPQPTWIVPSEPNLSSLDTRQEPSGHTKNSYNSTIDSFRQYNLFKRENNYYTICRD